MEKVLLRLLSSKKELVLTPTYVRGVLTRMEIIDTETYLNVDVMYVGGICDIVIKCGICDELVHVMTGTTIEVLEKVLEVEHIK